MFDFLKNAPQTRTATLETPKETVSPASDASDVPDAPATESSPVPASASAPATDSACTRNSDSIQDYIRAHGFSVDIDPTRSYDEVCRPMRELTVYMAKNYKLLSGFLCYLRQRLVSDRTVEFSLNDLSEEAKAETICFVKEKLSPYGLLSNTVINGAGYILGSIPKTKRVTAFLTGGWLEIYARVVAEEEISRLARELGVGYQILSNVTVSKGDIVHELDVICQLDKGRLCVIEAKSGNRFRNYEKLLAVGQDLATIPNYTLLLDANKTVEAAESIRYLYEIFCCTLNSSMLRTQLREMLRKSVEN